MSFTKFVIYGNRFNDYAYGWNVFWLFFIKGERIMPEEETKKISINLWNKTTTFQKFLLLFIIGFPFYIASTTKLVPNYQCINQTINGTLNTNCGVLYSDEDYVPKSFMSNGHAIIEGISILILFFSFLAYKQIGRIPIPEAIRIMKDELKKIKELPTVEGESISIRNQEFTLPSGVITRYRENEGKWMEFRYTIGMTVKDPNNPARYYKGMVHPYTGYFDGFVPTEKEMRDWDMCSRCGKEYDVATYTDKDLKKLYEIRRGISGH